MGDHLTVSPFLLHKTGSNIVQFPEPCTVRYRAKPPFLNLNLIPQAGRLELFIVKKAVFW